MILRQPWRPALLDRRWYCIETHPGKERLAAEQVERLKLEVFLPRRRIIYRDRVRRGSRSRIAPLFEGYAFVAFDTANDPWRKVHKSRGVRRVMSANAEMPLAIPDDAMARIFKFVGPTGIADDEPPAKADLPPLAAGQQLCLTGGPLEGELGICADARGDRVWLRLTKMAGMLIVVARSHVELA